MNAGRPAVVWAIVVAAGTGSRFGGLKQYEPLGGRRILDWSIEAARSVAQGIVLAVAPERAGKAEAGADLVVTGGATRSQSVRAALAAVPQEASVVVVHDAARPLAPPALFTAVVDALAGDVDAAVPGLAVTDTVKRVRAGRVVATLDRSELFVVQTPQAFDARVLRRAHATCAEGTDDAALVEASGGVVAVVRGDAGNIKVTTAADLDRLRRQMASPAAMPS